MSGATVLGYGALLEPGHVRDLCGDAHVSGLRAGVLTGWRRHWNLVYRNGCWAEGRYVHSATGEAYEGGVAFLGVEKAPGLEMPVLEIGVTDRGLAAIDDEEFMYRRVDVATRYLRRDASKPPSGPIWFYRDVPEEFPEAAYRGNRVVVARNYLESVRSAAADLAPGGLVAFERSTRPCPWPVVDLCWRVAAP